MKQLPTKPIAIDTISTKEHFTQFGGLYRDKRQQLKFSVTQVAQRTGLPEKLFQNLEAGDLGSITLKELVTAARGIGSVIRMSFAPERATLPKQNSEVLAVFDDLIENGRFKPFIRGELDPENPDLRWEIVGDVDRNWLYVVASNPKKNIRFAKVTDNPGSWSIASQKFGIDVETNAIAGDLSDQLFQAHKAELIGK